MQKSQFSALSLVLTLSLFGQTTFAQAPAQNYVLKIKPNSVNAQAVDLEACALDEQSQQVTQCWDFFADLSQSDLQQVADRLEDQRNWRVLGLAGSVIAGGVALISTSVLAFMTSGASVGATGILANASGVYYVSVMAPGILVESYGLASSIPQALGPVVVASGPIFWSSVGHYITAGKADGINPTSYNRAMKVAANLPEAEQKIDRKSLTKLLKAIRVVKGVAQD